jgi:hypothetical protein
LEQAGRDPVAGLAVQMDRADHMKTKSWARRLGRRSTGRTLRG